MLQSVDQSLEEIRLAAVRRYDILDTPADGSFDHVTALAAELFSVPIAIISLVDHDRIWFKSHHGLDAKQIDRAPGLCASAILQNGPWIVCDAKTDVRALSNPLVAGEFGLRFYAGVPLRTSDGFNLGTLCIIDREPRAASEQEIARLARLASVVMDQMELRLSSRRAVADLSAMVTEKDTALRRSELLAKEIDHRVSNSLQLISSLIHLQSRTLAKTEASRHLAVAASRVTAVAQAHRHIYMTDGIKCAECKVYLERLCRDLSLMLNSAQRGEIVVKAIDAEIPTGQLVTVGLIVNELVSNAAKHGTGKITVSFERTGPDYLLSVADQGVGLPEGFDPATSLGLGMKVISSLVQKLDGRLSIGIVDGSDEAKVGVQFPDGTQLTQK